MDLDLRVTASSTVTSCHALRGEEAEPRALPPQPAKASEICRWARGREAPVLHRGGWTHSEEKATGWKDGSKSWCPEEAGGGGSPLLGKTACSPVSAPPPVMTASRIRCPSTTLRFRVWQQRQKHTVGALAKIFHDVEANIQIPSPQMLPVSKLSQSRRAPSMTRPSEAAISHTCHQVLVAFHLHGHTNVRRPTAVTRLVGGDGAPAKTPGREPPGSQAAR